MKYEKKNDVFLNNNMTDFLYPTQQAATTPYLNQVDFFNLNNLTLPKTLKKIKKNKAN